VIKTIFSPKICLKRALSPF